MYMQCGTWVSDIPAASNCYATNKTNRSKLHYEQQVVVTCTTFIRWCCGNTRKMQWGNKIVFHHKWYIYCCNGSQLIVQQAFRCGLTTAKLLFTYTFSMTAALCRKFRMKPCGNSGDISITHCQYFSSSAPPSNGNIFLIIPAQRGQLQNPFGVFLISASVHKLSDAIHWSHTQRCWQGKNTDVHVFRLHSTQLSLRWMSLYGRWIL